MAKITMTIEDKEDGEIGFSMDMDPPLSNEEKVDTEAQYLAALMLKALDGAINVEE